MLGDLLNQIPQDERIDSVYTDGAYDTKQCRQVIADRQAHAVIPPRKNAKQWKDTKSSSLERNELLRTKPVTMRKESLNKDLIIKQH